jgi:glycosyltransferase involved in cell wall biosynthesis
VKANSISVFFPLYNEQDNIRRIYESASKVLKGMALDYEIILVNDGSVDRTKQIADAIAATDSQVKVVHHDKNLGYGSALQSGFRAAAKTVVFYTDGDGQFDLNDLPPILSLVERYDIVSCFRIRRQDGLIRKINSWCWTMFICCIFRFNVRDINCAFKLYQRHIFDKIELLSTGALINAEIFARSVRCGFNIVQVGVNHYPRVAGRQTGANPAVVLRAFVELFTLYRKIVMNSLLSSKKSQQNWMFASFFFYSAGLMLLITSLAKLVSSFGGARAVLMPDPIWAMPFRYVFMGVGIIELAVAAVCFFSKRVGLKTGLVAWLATNFVVYRIGLLWVGYHKPCNCMGTLTDTLHISPRVADNVMLCVLMYLLIGSYIMILWLWLRKRSSRAVPLPQAATRCD